MGKKPVHTSDEPSSHVRTQTFLSRSAALCEVQLNAQHFARDTRLLALVGFIRFYVLLSDSLSWTGWGNPVVTEEYFPESNDHSSLGKKL